MIYIDPPYNTGNDFVYRDNFTVDKGEYDEEAGVYDEEGGRLFKNTETNGRFHSDWCSMMYPRLVLARNLLSSDGVMLISIDNNEFVNILKLCDEVFGEENFITNVTWEKGRKNDSTFFSDSVEYIVFYAKNIHNLISLGAWREKKYGLDEIFNYYNKMVSVYKNDYATIEQKMKDFYNDLPEDNPAKELKHFFRSDERGLYFGADISSASTSIPDYDIYHPVTKRPVKKPSRGWGATEPVMLKRIADNRVLFGTDETTIPLKKSYLSEVDTIVKTPVVYKDGRGASLVLKNLIGATIFNNPKDHSVLKDLFSYIFQKTKEGIVIDFFSGSASTAHAVIELNADDGGKRKFIMVQLPEICAEGSEAAKAGHNNICEIGKERIRRAGDKIKAEAGLTAQNLDIGFRVLKLDDTNMKDVYYAAGEYTQNLLDLATSNIKDDRNDMDLLYGCLLDWGLPLSLPHTHEKIDGVTVHTYNNGDLIACFADTVSDKVVKEIAKRQPLRAVFRDSGFSSSPEKINVAEIFKLLAPNTSVKVI